MSDTWEKYDCFVSSIYRLSKPEFLPLLSPIVEGYIDVIQKEQGLDPIYPSYQTYDIKMDNRISEFTSYVSQTCWNILESQGYDMKNLLTYIKDMWVQSHYKTSSMEKHIHGGDIQIVGFYFIDTPVNSSRVVYHDPRPGKSQINLPEENFNNLTYASETINFVPEPGTLMFSNAFVPHSFTRNTVSQPFNFIHFNVGVFSRPENNYQVEVI